MAKVIVETTPEMDALNAADGRGGDYRGKTLVLHKGFFRPKHQVGDRRFYCTGGFGANPADGKFMDGFCHGVGRGFTMPVRVEVLSYDEKLTVTEAYAKKFVETQPVITPIGGR
jgi:hypothetical protein